MLAEAQRKHDHVPRFLIVLPRGKFVRPATVPLTTAKPVGSLGADAFNQAPVDQNDFGERSVVLLHDLLRNDTDQTGFTLEAGIADVSRSRRANKPARFRSLVGLPPDPLRCRSCFAGTTTRKQKPYGPLALRSTLVLVPRLEPRHSLIQRDQFRRAELV